MVALIYNFLVSHLVSLMDSYRTLDQGRELNGDFPHN